MSLVATNAHTLPRVTIFQAHLLCLAGLVALGIVLVRTGQLLKAPAQRHRFQLALGICGLINFIGVEAWWAAPVRFAWEKSLPLQVCDLVGLFAALAMLTRIRLFRSLLHFWGFALCTQWACTPTTTVGPTHAEFWMGVLLHGQIIIFACIDWLAFDYRPRWKDLGITFGVGVVYAALMLPINLSIPANYGYMGKAIPGVPTIVDKLGAWPLRLLWMALIGLTGMVFVKLLGGVIQGLFLSRPTTQPTENAIECSPSV